MDISSSASADETPTTQETIREVTLTIEFLTTALRALVDGHDPSGEMVRSPLLWGRAKLRDLVSEHLKSKSDISTKW
ncbi:hypothetical protein [Afifella pfennigii]|uniref:hypothetical protein n=1 Tax=Afifella pfennigii TaxID=209897 RepID=UPI00054FAC03|nr:hypothetical protein [Afifella pfennigii]